MRISNLYRITSTTKLIDKTKSCALWVNIVVSGSEDCLWWTYDLDKCTSEPTGSFIDHVDDKYEDLHSASVSVALGITELSIECFIDRSYNMPVRQLQTNKTINFGFNTTYVPDVHYVFIFSITPWHENIFSHHNVSSFSSLFERQSQWIIWRRTEKLRRKYISVCPFWFVKSRSIDIGWITHLMTADMRNHSIPQQSLFVSFIPYSARTW